jgi:hypothetical protein
MNLNLELTIDEVNMILRSLGKHPFEEIANLIGKIKAQGEPQVATAEAAQQEAAAAQQESENDAAA